MFGTYKNFRNHVVLIKQVQSGNGLCVKNKPNYNSLIKLLRAGQKLIWHKDILRHFL